MHYVAVTGIVHNDPVLTCAFNKYPQHLSPRFILLDQHYPFSGVKSIHLIFFKTFPGRGERLPVQATLLWTPTQSKLVMKLNCNDQLILQLPKVPNSALHKI
jgi:hypothetical protein